MPAKAGIQGHKRCARRSALRELSRPVPLPALTIQIADILSNFLERYVASGVIRAMVANAREERP
jgi:hypothetical protein